MKKLTLVTLLLTITACFSYGQLSKESVHPKWKLSKVEEFGDQYKPTAEQKGDVLHLNADDTFTGRISGKDIKGTWSVSGEKIVFKLDKAGSAMKLNWLRFKSVSNEELQFSMQDKELITSTYIMVPAGAE